MLVVTSKVWNGSVFLELFSAAGSACSKSWAAVPCAMSAWQLRICGVLDTSSGVRGGRFGVRVRPPRGMSVGPLQSPRSSIPRESRGTVIVDF